MLCKFEHHFAHTLPGVSHSLPLSLPIYHPKFIIISSCINNISSTNHISHVAPQIATGVITIAVEQCVGTIYVFFNTNWRMSRDFWACAWVHDEWLNDWMMASIHFGLSSARGLEANSIVNIIFACYAFTLPSFHVDSISICFHYHVYQNIIARMYIVDKEHSWNWKFIYSN